METPTGLISSSMVGSMATNLPKRAGICRHSRLLPSGAKKQSLSTLVNCPSFSEPDVPSQLAAYELERIGSERPTGVVGLIRSLTRSGLYGVRVYRQRLLIRIDKAGTWMPSPRGSMGPWPSGARRASCLRA